MNAPVKTYEVPTVPGTPFQGGFYAGRLRINGAIHAVIVAPKADGETPQKVWGEYGTDTEATSFCDGRANTKAMLAAGYELALWASSLSINGFTDWHIPSRDELEVCYRNLKPSTETNTRYSGDNPSNCSYAYSLENPAQTSASAFQDEGPEAFEENWYWSSTQFSANFGWIQDFYNGCQGNNVKGEQLRARAVRTIQLDHLAI